MTLSRVHASAALVATLIIALFFSSTVVVEATGDHRAIAWVKTRIVAPGLFVLVPALALTGGSGFMLSRGWRSPLIARKERRMPVIAANGLLILVSRGRRPRPVGRRREPSTPASTSCRRSNCWPGART